MNQSVLFEDDAKDADKKPSEPINAADLASVLVPYPVDKSYSYAIPEGERAVAGTYVTVPLGSRQIVGVVWDDEPDTAVKRSKLKSIIQTHDMAPMPKDHRKFIDWAADYNMAAKGAVLKMALPVQSALEAPKPITGYKVRGPIGEAERTGLSPQRKAVLHVLDDGVPRRAAEIAELAGCSASVVKTMLERDYLEIVDIFTSAPCRHPDADREGFALSEQQQKAADLMDDAVNENAASTLLLDGVTGAGKTEVYFEGVAAALKKGKQVLILLPEIALSNAFLDRFYKRFGCKPALWHSSISSGQRKRTWRGVAQGETKVVIGARSALFLPYQNLGLIVVDEEHDPAYKQEDNVIYHARDMAVVRGHIGQFPVILVSATPSLETMANVWNGRYRHLKLPDRYGGARLPQIHVIDMKKDKPARQHFISPTLKEAIKANMEAGKQSLLFLNRRGYAPLTLCRTCGHRMECPRCTAWLVEHRQTSKLHCHHCGYAAPQPRECPSCEDEDSFAACGPGVERIFEEVKNILPEARSVILASDTASSHEELTTILDDIKNHEYDIIVGTQIIAKGHHFPKLTLVGIVDADLGLQGGDLRAAERSFQLLHQVSGRAGREKDAGHVYLQTFLPENKVMKAIAGYNRDEFLTVEAGEREGAFMPPYARLVGIIVSGKDEDMVKDIARALGRTAPKAEGLQVLGPAEAPFYRLRGNYRYRLLVRADKKLDIQKTVNAWVGNIKCPSNMRIYIDIDPQSFF